MKVTGHYHTAVLGHKEKMLSMLLADKVSGMLNKDVRLTDR